MSVGVGSSATSPEFLPFSGCWYGSVLSSQGREKHEVKMYILVLIVSTVIIILLRWFLCWFSPRQQCSVVAGGIFYSKNEWKTDALFLIFKICCTASFNEETQTNYEMSKISIICVYIIYEEYIYIFQQVPDGGLPRIPIIYTSYIICVPRTALLINWRCYGVLPSNPARWEQAHAATNHVRDQLWVEFARCQPITRRSRVGRGGAT